jgi:hypothetical protein
LFIFYSNQNFTMAEKNFEASPTVNITTTYPAGVSHQQIVAHLHDHDTYIRATCPELVSYEKISGEAGLDLPVSYSVTDKKPIGKTTYSLIITNRVDGIETKVNAKAPIGSMIVESKWVATPTELIERIWVDGNMIVKKMVKTVTEKNHPEVHQVLYKKGKTPVAVAA